MRLLVLLLLLASQLPSPQAPQVPAAPTAPRILPAEREAVQPPPVTSPPADQLPRPTPRQGVPTAAAVATVTMFWDQSAPTLSTITGSYLYAYYIDCNQSTGQCASQAIPITATCADKTPPVMALFGCNGQMTSLINGTHTYTLEVQCASCADPKNVRSNAVSYTYAGSSSVAGPSTIAIESGSGTTIPPATGIVDSKGATWTQGSAVPASCPAGVTGHPASDCLDQLRNGAKISLGSQIYYKNRVLYVLGPDGSTNSWWQWLDASGCPGGSTNQCWTKIGTTKP